MQIILNCININCSGLTTSADDEYKWAGVEDPKVMVTTSRDPSSKLKQFAKVNVYDHTFSVKNNLNYCKFIFMED